MQCKSCLLHKQERDFYVSNSTKCKECVKAAVKQNRLENLEHYRLYDRQRGQRPERKAAREAYERTAKGKLAHTRATEKWRVSNSVRRQAQNKVNAAIRDGKLMPQPCFVCGADAHAHHPDYSRPLSVTWLCSVHHKAAHKAVAEILHKTGQRESLRY